MKIKQFAGAVALGFAVFAATAAMADDPNDPAMKDRAARALDKKMTREANLRQLEQVRRRDAGYAAGWQAYRDYPQAQAEHERAMAQWRRAVKLCESGHYEYCRG
ncbi:MAG: hypothetical protein IE933_14515 [Sphingomonadales bacterium]|nr:hypothetical protein [Sphingomonadales bacterium]MBD3775203.1 hypothetical protein [Paracoccaceae bacterium]